MQALNLALKQRETLITENSTRVELIYHQLDWSYDIKACHDRRTTKHSQSGSGYTYKDDVANDEHTKKLNLVLNCLHSQLR